MRLNVQIHSSEISVLVDHGYRWVDLFEVYLMKLINGVLGRQRLLQAQPNHLPGEIPTHIVHRHAHARVEVEVVDVRRLGRVAVELPPIHVAIPHHAHRGVRHIQIRRRRLRNRTRGQLQVQGLGRAATRRHGVLGLQQSLYLLCEPGQGQWTATVGREGSGCSLRRSSRALT